MSSKHYFHALLLLLLAIGCAVSALASGRFAPRLILDGAISFWFVPAFELVAFAIVVRPETRVRRFAPMANAFFAGHTPWLLWLVAVTALGCVVPPWPLIRWMDVAATAACLPIAWCTYIDFRFFRDTLGRSPGSAITGAVLFRALAWSAILIYFFGIALWATVLPRLGMAVDR